MTYDDTGEESPAGAMAPSADASVEAVAAGRGDGRTPSLVVNALSSWAGFAVTVAAGLILTPIIISRLGKSGYGIWCLVGSVVGYYGLLDLGVSSAVRRYVARYAARGDRDALNETVSTALAVFAAAGAVMIAVSALAGGPLGAFFELSGPEANQFRYVIILLGVAAAANIVGQVYRAMIAGYERFVIRNMVLISVTMVRAVLTVWTLSEGWGLVGVAGAYMVVDVLALIVDVVLVRWLMPDLCVGLRLWRRRRARRLFTYGLTMTVVVGAGVVQTHMASVVLAKVVSLEAVGVYAVAALLIRHFSNLIHAGMGVLGPRFAALQGVEDLENLKALLVKALWVSSMLSFAVAAALLVLGPRFLHLWVGPRFSEGEVATSASVLTWLAVAYAVGLAQDPGATVLYSMNRHRTYAWIMVAEAAGSVVLGVVLGRRMGAVGVAIGASSAILASRLLAQPVYVSRVVGLSLSEYVAPVVVPMCAGAGVWALWETGVWPLLPSVGYGGLVLAGACIALTYLAALVAVQAGADAARGRPVRLAIPFVSSTPV